MTQKTTVDLRGVLFGRRSSTARTGEPALRTILESLAEEPKSVDELAKATGMVQPCFPRYLSKLIKYDLVVFDKGKYAIRDRTTRDYLNLAR
ncbi:MAG: ArsR family transcriptional regulator [Nitrososphaerota archaeon]|nr:ArsR family transcriptional regulator [Nitrososphaerota archaeon]